MDIPSILDRLGLSSQEWGPGGRSGATYEELVAGWRGNVPVPTQQQMDAAWAEIVGLGGLSGLELLALRAAAKACLASAKDAQAKKDRAVVAILLNEINDLRAWITSFKAATAAATNLADFKTRVSALSNTPARTMSQAQTKYEAMIDSGKHDDGMVD